MADGGLALLLDEGELGVVTVEVRVIPRVSSVRPPSFTQNHDFGQLGICPPHPKLRQDIKRKPKQKAHLVIWRTCPWRLEVVPAWCSFQELLSFRFFCCYVVDDGFLNAQT